MNLARNTLLLSMILDDVPALTMWNIFFHFYVDRATNTTLLSQCRKLLHASSSIDDWRSSTYGSTIRVGTAHTLAELRRYWTLYMNFEAASTPTITRAQERVGKVRETVMRHYAHGSWNVSSTRSSGPLITVAISSDLYAEQFRQFWKTGTTYTSQREVAIATYPNATFFYSKAGEGFNVHYGTDPMASFHLAPVFGNAKRKPVVGDLVAAARSQFRDWCVAFRRATAVQLDFPVIRVLLGDAVAVARVLHAHAHSQKLTCEGITVEPWTTRVLELDKGEYGFHNAPTRFDVIDTSNLSDFVGLINIFLSTIPLLSNTMPSPVLYTESLLSQNFGFESTMEFRTKLFADLSSVALLLDLAPVDALSGFTTRSNTHELMLLSMRTQAVTSIRQYHQPLTWKRLQSADSQSKTFVPVSVDSHTFADLLHDVYCHLFADQDIISILSATRKEDQQSAKLLQSQIPSLAIPRESFVILLHLVRSHLQIPASAWSETMSLLVDRLQRYHPNDSSMFALSNRELHAQLLRYRLYIYPGIEQVGRPSLGRLSHWETPIPPLLRVYLTVPWSRLMLLDKVVDEIPTPWLQCIVRSSQDGFGEHIFQSVDAAFAVVVDSGPASSPEISLQEERDGRRDGTSLVVSFVVPTILLTGAKDPNSVLVALSVRPSLAAMTKLVPVLGLALVVSSAAINDTQSVHIAPEHPLSESSQPHVSGMSHTTATGDVGTHQYVHADLDAGQRSVKTLTARLQVDDHRAKAALGTGATPQVTHISPCSIQVQLGRRTQRIWFPLPVAQSQPRVRIARKSSYLEVCC